MSVGDGKAREREWERESKVSEGCQGKASLSLQEFARSLRQQLCKERRINHGFRSLSPDVALALSLHCLSPLLHFFTRLLASLRCSLLSPLFLQSILSSQPSSLSLVLLMSPDEDK